MKTGISIFYYLLMLLWFICLCVTFCSIYSSVLMRDIQRSLAYVRCSRVCMGV